MPGSVLDAHMSRPETKAHFLHEKTRTGHMPKVNVIIP